jgi:hypothetical protein
MKNLDKRGGKGMLTLGCLPLWEREGVFLLVPVREYANTGGKRISAELIFSDLCRL